ncbi:unnamed protein product [Soboliphyme baturini]|uniref:Uncharacterized protein n=1 Tax=Soboliphyme baturini TaxID=241478 RepID=A0A183IFA7_9BILA|nr:unnamed protein product [Soboliphyme baturini]
MTDAASGGGWKEKSNKCVKRVKAKRHLSKIRPSVRPSVCESDGKEDDGLTREIETAAGGFAEDSATGEEKRAESANRQLRLKVERRCRQELVLNAPQYATLASASHTVGQVDNPPSDRPPTNVIKFIIRQHRTTGDTIVINQKQVLGMAFDGPQFRADRKEKVG